MGPDKWGVAIQNLRKIIEKNEQKLAYFQNRLKQAEFMDRPNQRLVSTAGGLADSYADGLGALRSELQELERLYGGSVKLRSTEKHDFRRIWRWINEPGVRAILHTEPIPFRTYVNRWHYLLADADTQPLSIDLATNELIGFVLIEQTGSGSKPRFASLEFIIISPDYRYRGYGTEALKGAIGFAFEQLEVEVFTVKIDLDNEPALQCFEKSGFRWSIDIKAASDVESDVGQNLHDMHIRREDWERTNSPPEEFAQEDDSSVRSTGSKTHLSAKLLAPLKDMITK